MQILIKTFENTGDIHHAYLLEGEKERIRNNLLDFISKKLKHPIQGNPDFWHERFETFSIDDARRLREEQTLKPIAYPRKIFIVETLLMTVEAQNALLKIFEEPTPGTHFFLIADSADVFLPTLRSRMIVVSDDVRAESGKDAKKFLSASVKDRLLMIEPIIEGKDKVAAGKLIDGLITERAGDKVATNADVLKELLKLRSYLNDRSPSLKLILEHIATIL